MVKTLINFDMVKWLLTAAWAAGLGVFGYVLAINTHLTELQKDVEELQRKSDYIEKESDSFVRKDVYEVDKLLLIERMKRRD